MVAPIKLKLEEIKYIMTKLELIARVNETVEGLTKKEAESAVNAVLDIIVEEVVSGNKVGIIGFGTFEARERAERTGRNPQTKEEMIIPASTVPKFKAAKAFKEAVAK